ncbi:MAG TPA: pitrilysin family protein [Quisquiliibacterium sp.]|nr:pitrilysin family protein [Quisquiliibacterium sp.]HPA90066.1 pitrilysin family protein [Quisquiliibacterium sp.]HQD83632.1 pitrilysin family protein [Quisquiliibacterium sp.]HQN12841.1 pitrilysin family protein [Quisquiliibacterium sp.]HQP65551.1 pitrilysin family protein [Quisquiliibacterium sp.]
MIPRRFVAAALLALLHALYAAGAALAQTTERVLANGMKVLVIEDHRAPTVAHMVWYRAGSIDEVNGGTGVAHVLEHMMFKGTRDLPAGEFSRRVAAMGGRENAFTSRDYTGYYQQVHRSRLADVMALEADRMANLVLSKEEFDKEIRVVMEERRWRTEDRAESLVYEQLMAAAFTASPYRAPVVGWMNDLEAMTVDDARDWYERWYTPGNALLVVAGDVTPAEVFELAERTYGRIASRALPPRKPQLEPQQRGVRRIWVKAPAQNPYVLMGFKVPRLADVAADGDVYALEVLAAVLDLDENGRITRNVVRSARIANSAGAGYDMVARGPALFTLAGTPSEGRSTEDVERALRAEIARIADQGVREDELQRVKTQYVASRVYRRDSVFGQAMEAAGLEIAGFRHDDSDRILERIRAVTAEQVRAVARKYFDEDTLTVATLLPQPVEPRRGPAPAGVRHQ